MKNETVVIIECQGCGQEVGRLIKLKNGKEALVVNGFAVHFMRGVCLQCKREFHWDPGVRKLGKEINGE